MKNSLLLVVMSILLVFPLTVTAQKNKESDYNLRKAYELLEKNDQNEAMKYLNQQIEEYPKSVEAYAMRARVLMEQNKYGNALTDINKSIKFWKKDERTKQYTLYWWRAVIYSNMEMYDKSFADFDQVYKLEIV